MINGDGESDQFSFSRINIWRNKELCLPLPKVLINQTLHINTKLKSLLQHSLLKNMWRIITLIVILTNYNSIASALNSLKMKDKMVMGTKLVTNKNKSCVNFIRHRYSSALIINGLGIPKCVNYVVALDKDFFML